MEQHLRFARILTNILENQFSVGGYRLGLDPILGLIPGIGDLIPLMVSFYVLWIAYKLQLPNTKIAQMIWNNIIEFFVGLFPIVGGLADNMYRANTRNMKILENYSAEIIEGQVVEY